jgi:hypothetical protein
MKSGMSAFEVTLFNRGLFDTRLSEPEPETLTRRSQKSPGEQNWANYHRQINGGPSLTILEIFLHALNWGIREEDWPRGLS